MSRITQMTGRLALVLAVLMMLAGSAAATTGYFSHGYGIKYKGIGGAGAALPLSSLAAANNPGALVFLGKRYDVEVGVFSPVRSYTVTGMPSGAMGTFGLAPGKVDSESEYFVIPALGGNWVLQEDLTLGVALYGNGGMNTDWPTNTFGGSTPTGVDLSQMFLAPSLSYRIADIHGLGITPILAYQWFEAKGLEAFGMFSSDATKLTNNGHANSFGGGVRIGYLGQFTPKFSLAASYQTKIWMSEFDEYAGLFAEKGDFDIPSTWVIGVGFKPNDQWRLALDVQQILYTDVKAVSNPMLPNLQTSMLGASDGAGFGWQDILIVKGGAEVDVNEAWTVRAGYAWNEQPIPESEVMFNILAPGVQQHHITGGASWRVNESNELGLAIMYSPSSSVTGPNPLEAPGQQTIEIEMSQWEIILGYSYF